MEAVTGARFPRAPARLPGHRRARIAGAVYPAVVPAPEADTEGALYRGVDAAALELLDRFEGDLYARRRLRVEPRDGPPEAAFVYVLAEGRRHLLTGEPWDPDAFAREHLARYVRACSEFRRRATGGAR